MNASSSNSSSRGRDESLALAEDIRERLGERRYRLIKLWVRDVNGAFDAALASHIDEHAVVLDAGCSRGDPDLPSIARARQAVGCDADLPGLRANVLMNHRVQGRLDKLPFRDGAFDVVVCKFVVEHLEDPVAVFGEFRRLLREGGVVALLTPNRRSPFALVSGLAPYRLKQVVKARLFGGHEEDTFPAVYRANTRATLARAMAEAGFEEERFRFLPGMWAFFIFCRPLALLVRWCEEFQARIPGARSMGTYLMGCWRAS